MAATRTLKAKVELDGEKEYKEAISQLNAGNKTLAAEMRLLQAEFKDNADSMEFLTAKGDLLGRMLDQQKEKTAEVQKMVEQASQAYAEAAKAYAESADEDADAQAAAAKALQDADKKLQGYMASLYSAQTAEAELTQAIDENNEAMENEGQTMVGLGDTLDQLADKFGVDIPDGAKKALNGVEGFSAGSVAAMAAAAAGVAAVITVLKELSDLTIEVAAQVDEYITESAITGVSTEILQAWDYAAPLIDTDAETIKGAMTRLTQAMGEARDGNDETIAKFQKLGVEFEDSTGHLRNAEDVFYDVIDALGVMANGSERDAAAMELMGKSAQELNPLIIAGRETLEDFAEEAEAVGYILSEDQVAALGAVDDAYQELKLTVEAVKKQIAADFAPAAEEAMTLFKDVVQKAGQALKDSGLIENLATIITCLIDIIRDIGDLLGALPGFNNALNGVKVTLGAIAQFVALIADAADVVSGILNPSNWGSGKAQTALGWKYDEGQASHWQTVYMQQNGTYDQYAEYYANKNGTTTREGYGYGIDPSTGAYGYYDLKTGNFSYNASGNDNWRGGLTWVGENGPEIANLPAGTQILSAQESRDFGGDTFYITIDAASVKEFNDIVEVAQSARVRGRMR